MAASNHRLPGGYSSLPASNLPGSVPVAADPDHLVLPFQEANLQTFPPSDARTKLLGSYPASHEADDSYDNKASEVGRNDGQGGVPNFLKISKYQPYFNVDTRDVSCRVMQSFSFNQANFLDMTRLNPDLYGPFWICTTLIFVAGALGNYAKYFIEPDSWQFDISKVNWAAGLLYGYTCLIPLALYLFLRYIGQQPIDLVQLWCLYGYSLFVFIPASVLSLIPLEGLRWLLIAMAGLVSALFVAFNLKSHVHNSEGSFFITTGSFVLHCALSIAMKIVFFP